MWFRCDAVYTHTYVWRNPSRCVRVSSYLTGIFGTYIPPFCIWVCVCEECQTWSIVNLLLTTLREELSVDILKCLFIHYSCGTFLKQEHVNGFSLDKIYLKHIIISFHWFKQWYSLHTRVLSSRVDDTRVLCSRLDNTRVWSEHHYLIISGMK